MAIIYDDKDVSLWSPQPTQPSGVAGLGFGALPPVQPVQTGLNLTPEEIEYLRRRTLGGEPSPPSGVNIPVAQAAQNVGQFLLGKLREAKRTPSQEELQQRYEQQQVPWGDILRGSIPLQRIFAAQTEAPAIQTPAGYQQMVAAIAPDITGGWWKGRQPKNVADLLKTFYNQFRKGEKPLYQLWDETMEPAGAKAWSNLTEGQQTAIQDAVGLKATPMTTDPEVAARLAREAAPAPTAPPKATLGTKPRTAEEAQRAATALAQGGEYTVREQGGILRYRELPDTILLTDLVVPTQVRRTGIATRLLDQPIALSQATGKPLESGPLSPDGYSFFKGLENKGRISLTIPPEGTSAQQRSRFFIKAEGAGIPPVPPKPPAAVGGIGAAGEAEARRQRIAEWFGRLTSTDSKVREAARKQAQSAAIAERFDRFQVRWGELIQQGVEPEAAMRQLRQEVLSSPLVPPNLHLAVPSDLRSDMFAFINIRYADDVGERLSTATALTNALDRGAIPPAAYQRLVRTFGEEITASLERPSSLQELPSSLQELWTYPAQSPAPRFGGLPQQAELFPATALEPVVPPKVIKAGYTPKPTGGRPSSRTELEAFKVELAGLMKPGGQVDQDLLKMLSKLTNKGKQLDLLAPQNQPLVSQVLKQVGNGALELGDALRTLQASFDVSFIGRQGLLASIKHPIAGGRAFYRGLKALGSQKFSEFIDTSLRQHPDVLDFIRRKGFWAPLDPASVARALREEAIPSRLVSKVPGIRASNRAYTVMANSLRADLVKMGYKVMRAGKATDVDYNEFARFVNILTGRGEIPQSLSRAAPVLNSLLFSPRLLMSRIQLPTMLASRSRFVRAEAAKTLAALIGFTATSMGIAALAGGKIELDPRSAAFGKVLIGNTYIDMTGGYTQYVRTIARLVTGRAKQPGGEVVQKAWGKTLVQFFQSKESPIASLVDDLISGETYGGKPIEYTPKGILEQATLRITPLAVTSIVDALVEEGWAGAAAGIPELAGFSTVRYASPPPFILPPETATPQEVANINFQLHQAGITVGRATKSLGALDLNEKETLDYQYAVSEGIGRTLYDLLRSPVYGALTYEGQKSALWSAITQGREQARQQYVATLLQSPYTYPQGKLDEFSAKLDSAIGEYRQTGYGSKFRTAVAQIEEQYQLLGRDPRFAGLIAALPAEYKLLKAAEATVKPYFQLEAAVWAEYPPEFKQVYDYTEELRKTNPRKADQILEAAPAVVNVLEQIRRLEKYVRDNNPQVMGALRLFYGWK